MIIPFNCDKVRVTSTYGNRTLNGATSFHGGYDLVGVGSYDVVAVEAGTVIHSRMITDRTNRTWEWGNYICIRTKSGRYHYYCHLASRAVSKGQQVKAGDNIGVMGNTGYSFGAHLHFEVREADAKTKVNPQTVLGIPNTVGIYETENLDEALKILQKHGVINTPAYWKQNAKRLEYLPELLLKMAAVLK